MSAIEAIEYLKQIGKIDAKIETKIEEEKRLFELATRVTPVMQDCVVSHSGNSGRVESYAIKIADLRQEINMCVDELVDTRREINELIEQLQSERQYKVLYKRYFEGKKWEQIACEIGCSYQSVNRIHKRALRNVEAMLKNRKNVQGG